MEYILYANIDSTISRIGERVLQILKGDNVFGEVSGINIDSNEINCCCDIFNLFIYNSSDSIQYIADESKLSLNIGFYMDLNTQCENVVAKAIYFVGRIMKEFSGNIVLMQNGDTPIVIRSGKDVAVDRSKVPDFYPFEMLAINYDISKFDF